MDHARPMIDSEAKIDANGIFLSFFKGKNRLWEFHPDDVTSVGAYSEGGRTHEVIVVLNREFDVPEGTPGLEDLNRRLSTELESEIDIDFARMTSPFGVVVWPPHLAGNALWEFYIIGKDGLSREVPPDSPNALRGLCRPLRREMRRNAKTHLPTEFPQTLVDRGFSYHGEIGWLRDDAVLAARWLREKGAAIVTAELWLVKGAVIQPHMQSESGIPTSKYSTATLPFETWELFANRTLKEVTAFMCELRWQDTNMSVGDEVRFCLTWVWKSWLEEDGYKFPE